MAPDGAKALNQVVKQALNILILGAPSPSSIAIQAKGRKGHQSGVHLHCFENPIYGTGKRTSLRRK